jgi:type I site-specific restriction endonuclease
MHLRDFEEGTCNVILNVGVLTLGWDWPPVRKLFIARPTRSKSRYIQMFGRGTRALPGVVDGWATADQRKQAIAGSDKAFFEVFDITDTSRHNDLQTAIDILNPSLDRKLLKRVRQAAENSTAALDIDPIVESERQALAAEEAALESLEMDRRQRMVMQARFGVYGRDIFAEAEKPDRPKQRQWHMLFGKHKGQPLRTVPTTYLRWVLEASNCRNAAFIEAVQREVRSRRP